MEVSGGGVGEGRGLFKVCALAHPATSVLQLECKPSAFGHFHTVLDSMGLPRPRRPKRPRDSFDNLGEDGPPRKRSRVLPDFDIGAQFKTFEDLKTSLNKYQRTEFCYYVTSKCIHIKFNFLLDSNGGLQVSDM